MPPAKPNSPARSNALLWPDPPLTLSIADYRHWLSGADGQLAQGFAAGVAIEHLVRQRAAMVDQLVRAAWSHFCPQSDEIVLVAVGGYGRGELHPHSDIDLLILLSDEVVTEPGDEVAAFLTFLWDLKLDVGHSVRSLSQCLDLARADVSVVTNLMEARLLSAAGDLFKVLQQSLTPPAMWPGRAYFEAKYAEQRERHQRYGDTAYNLEPNLKEGPGGLRDIQTIQWVAQRHYGVRSLHDLVRVDFLEESEYQALMRGQRHLWRIRFGLHLLAARREDRLLFEYQKSLAEQFGFEDHHRHNLAVEQFMQSYYRSVMQLERLNERLLQAFEEDILYAQRRDQIEPIDDDFQARTGYLELRHPETIAQRPEVLIKLFAVLQQQPRLKGVRAATIRTIRRHLDLIDDGFRAKSEHRACFIALLRQGGDIPALLTRMHRYGVLDRYLPAFGTIVGRMQYDLFHVYTVDQHTLFVLRQMYLFSQPSVDQSKYPMVHKIWLRMPKPVLLYLGGLFHDIAKGRGGDHSHLGASDAENFCRDHGLSEPDTALVCWLVHQHLLMSTTAQKKDIADPAVINQFARQVSDPIYLDYLYLLTVADISATSPKLWNGWRASLLSELYLLTRDALYRGTDNPPKRSDWVKDTQAEALRLLGHIGIDAAAVTSLWSSLPDDYFLRHSAEQIVRHTHAIGAGQDLTLPLVKVWDHGPRRASEVLVYGDNKDGTFATIVATFALANLSVVEARVVNSKDGRILDTFHVLDRQGRCLDPARAADLQSALAGYLSAVVLQPPVVERRQAEQLKHFELAPTIRFDQDPGGTLVELICADRRGLLVLVARVLLDLGLRIHGARIATFGERVEDYFVITDQQDRALDLATCQSLREALLPQLGDELSER